MKSAVIGLLAETGLHPGSEAGSGAIDLPVAREAVTGYPVIPGSSLKGALREKAERLWGAQDSRVFQVFGKQDGAGGVAVTDARLLLLPVRSLTSHYKWVTCPYILERFERDMRLAGLKVQLGVPRLQRGEMISSNTEPVFLEELSFAPKPNAAEPNGGIIKRAAQEIAKLINQETHKSVSDRLVEQLVICSDDDFRYFARYGLEVNARNVLDDKTKTSENLWYEEVIPPDAVFYAILLARVDKEDSLAQLKEIFRDKPYLQVGGNETVGQGWCAVTWLDGEGN